MPPPRPLGASSRPAPCAPPSTSSSAPDSYATAAGKRVLILLSYLSLDISASVRGEPRADAPLLDFLATTGLPVVDTLRMHLDDFAAYRCTTRKYNQRLFVGHYNPHGNHFFAYAIKDDLAAWLDPKPPAYDRAAGSPLQHLASSIS